MSKQNGYIARVLVVEDEPDLREAMVSYLNLEGFFADGVGSTSAADAWLQTHYVDIVVLDVGLPGCDGVSWLNQSEAIKGKGVVMATARHELQDRLRGLKAGADAYLVKPVDLEELHVIVNNLAGRIKLCKTQPPTDWQFNTLGWSLTAPNGSAIKLTRSETMLLNMLAAHPGQTVSKEVLIGALGHNPDTYDPRRMEIMVRRLRNKVRMQSSIQLPLETDHGLGYAFAAKITLAAIQD